MCVVFVNATEKSSNFLTITSILSSTLNIVEESNPPVILDSDHSGEKKHHPDRPVV
jgi:fructose/tagatose bisphosphate aldolase